MKNYAPLKLLIFLLLCILLAGCADEDAPALLRVMMTEGEGYTVEGENPRFVSPGESVSFRITTEDEWHILSAGAGEYDRTSGILTLKNVRYPVTVSPVAAHTSQRTKFFLELAQNGGSVVSDVPQGYVWAGTPVTASVTVKTGYRFNGWSLNRSLEKGGKLLSTSPEYTHTVTENTALYANFTELLNTDYSLTVWDGADPTRAPLRVTYHANGGVYAETGASKAYFEMPRYHVYENCLPAKDYFVREGYQLIEYNTAPDGSGDGYSLGSKLVADEAITLWCIWAKETDPSLFTWKEREDGVQITGYTGKESMLVIPEYIGGKHVTYIGRGAIRCPEAETIVLPKSVTEVESGAIVTSERFTTLYIWDSVVKIRDDSFTNIKGMAHVRLNAARNPSYADQTEGNFVKKWERIVSEKRKGKKMLAVMSGSSTFYSLDSAMMEQLLGGEYSVVNMGFNVTCSLVFFMEMLESYFGEGDILVYAPEINGNTRGQNIMSWKLMRGVECYYNVWRTVDMRNYTHFFSALTEFNTYRIGSPLDYTVSSDMVNEYGDRYNEMKYNRDNYRSGSKFRFQVNSFGKTELARLERAFARLHDLGVTVYMSCAPHNANSVVEEYRTAEAQDAYMDYIRSAVSIPVISHIKDYLLEGKLMYNSDYHTNGYGRIIRTERLAADILAQWAKEGR